MKRALAILLLLLAGCVPAHAATWYVSHLGGTITQCTGLSPNPYPGSGTGQACAVSDLFWLISNSTQNWITGVGDTIQFADATTNTTPYFEGEQNNGVGFDWSGPLSTICGPPNTNGTACILPPFIDGTTLLGQSAGLGSCHQSGHNGLIWGPNYPTILSGINDAFNVLDMQGTNNVTIKCIEITQPDACTLSGAAGNTITNTSASGGVYTYSWTNASGNPPLVGQRYTITGTTNGGGIFNVTNQHIVSVTGTTSGTFTIAGSGTVSSASESGLGVPTGHCTQANNYSPTGIRFEFATAQGPSNFTLQDVAIVGMASRGVLGSHINTTSGDVSSASDIYIFGNGFTGWDADGGGCGTSCETVGTLNITNLDVEWSGFVATTTIPVRDANVFDLGFTQNYGGQGDNIVQIAAGSMTFNTVNSFAKYGAQDGFDYLHISDDVSTNPIVNISGSWSEGNLGQTIKLGAGTSITAINNVSISNCAAMDYATTPPYSLNPLGWNSGLHPADICRASGDEWSFQPKNGTAITIENNTSTGYGATMYDFGCASLNSSCGTTVTIKFINNISKGYVNPVTSLLPGSFIFNSGSGPDMFANAGSILDHNLWNTMRTGSGCGGGFQPPEETNCTSADPLLVGETDINQINPNLTSSSPAIVNGILTGATPATDYNGNSQTSPPTQGAFVFGGTPTVATPTFSPVAGTYGPTQSVTISTSTGGASIVYTTDGSTPTVTAMTCTITHGTLYSGSLTVSTSQTIKAIGCLASDNASSVGTAVYVINGAATTPTFSPVAGTYASAQSVTLSTATSGCGAYLVWNTTNAQSGGNLTGTSSTNPLTVSSSETVYAQVQGCPTYVNSAIGSAAYTITGTVAAPTFTPPGGPYSGPQSVVCSVATGGASCVYTTDGSSPTVSSGCTITHGTLYTGPIPVTISPTTLKGIGCETGFTPSGVTTDVYTISAPNSTIRNGTYHGSGTLIR
jgi:hypothetical protein